jgi:hypothetical protein
MPTRTTGTVARPPETTSSRRVPIFGILSVALAPVAVLFAQLGGWTSDVFVDRPGNVSLTTLLPGMARATSRVLLACGVEGVAAGVIALAIGERPRWLPVLGLTAIALLLAVIAVMLLVVRV